ncbi:MULTISPECIES: methyltransferase domain-containing protein [Cetobacterium]|jgi:23S rRNA (guanine745-N1)-methyltransferase|uniref:Methyltransferase domain-containing protein n=1 Tax=Candidatus Cetobacterium colombiensis TaxID=3073100 RepID=A0ABU4WB50_9FUSO|nr:methyltransferase domain-containing protein [Candidatus Cetobacterium colombiensis]MDX8335708.1 methyltransferase domain-containing protein [Candidatus Cetobacterium colombiensis]
MVICPVCNKKMTKVERKFVCENNHNFDISKYGHVNLLLSNQKNSKIPGDNKEMVLSRKNYLEKDYYKGISEGVNKIIENNLGERKAVKILDIGCGEGYYTNRLKEKLDSLKIENEIVGIDISKEAVISAAKSYKKIDWIVASASSLPIEDESLDFIICMFAKIIPEEKMRTLKKGGKLIIVSTGEDHLLQLKEVVYESVRKEFYSPVEDLKIFKHLDTINVKYETEILEKESIENLFNMTPYRWRSPQKGVEKLFTLDKLKTIVEVNIDIFEKN